MSFNSNTSLQSHKLRTSFHADRRMEERNLPPCTVELVMYFGQEANRNGAKRITLTESSINRAAALGIDLKDYVGLSIVCASNTIITAYRRSN